MLDPISDMLTRIRNASRAGHTEVFVPFSKMKEKMAGIIFEKKFIESFSALEENGKRFVKIILKYRRDEKGKKHPYVENLKRISREGQRIYVTKNKISGVKSGFGFAIISTSKGLMTDEQARKAGLGGEVICEIY